MLSKLTERALPSALDAERAVMGCLIMNPDGAGAVACERLTEDSFYGAIHRVIFREVSALRSAGSPIDLVKLTTVLDGKNLLAEIGGAGALMDFAGAFFSPSIVETYIADIEDAHERRRIIDTGFHLTTKAFDGNVTLDELRGIISAHAASSVDRRSEFITMKSAVDSALANVNKILTSDRHITGLSTGFDKIDEKTLGLNNSDVWVVAARPGVGKTALCVSISLNVALRENAPVGIITLEQSAMALAKRAIASASRVNMRKLRETGHLDLARMAAKALELAAAQVVFDERPALTIRQIREAGRKMVNRHGARLLMLDYLQLGRADEKKHSRNEEVTDISAGIKAMAKELGVPVILLSQLNRAPATGNRRPTPADLRDSGAIEQDADLIAFINEDLSDDELPDEWQGKLNEAELANIVQFDIQKQREGERAAVYLRFDRQFTRFDNFSMQREPNANPKDSPWYQGEKQ